MSTKRRRSKTEGVNLVLWGEGGDEAATTLFVTLFRTAGLPVKVVGVGGTKEKGASGLILVPDLTLGEALLPAASARYILLPFDGKRLRRFMVDPRLRQFIDAAQEHEAIFIQSDQIADEVILSELFNKGRTYQTLFYPQGKEFYTFVQQIVGGFVEKI